MLFTLYPKVNFKVNNYDFIRAIDITTTYKIKDFFKNYPGISYQAYAIKDGERPDSVSFKFYNRPDFDWIILLANDIYNIYDEWPKDSLTLENYIIDKYGSIANAQGQVKYYYDADKDIIDATTYTSLPASQRSLETVYQYEIRQNDTKRIIRIISPSLTSAIQSSLYSLNINPIR
jgi:hypothetical protein